MALFFIEAMALFRTVNSMFGYPYVKNYYRHSTVEGLHAEYIWLDK